MEAGSMGFHTENEGSVERPPHPKPDPHPMPPPPIERPPHPEPVPEPETPAVAGLREGLRWSAPIHAVISSLGAE